MLKARKTSDLFYLIFLILMIVFSLLPIYWIYTTAFKTQADALSVPPTVFFRPTLNNFIEIFSTNNFTSPLLNSLITTTSATLISLIFGVPTAYAFSRWTGKSLKSLEMWVLSPQMLPPVVVLVPFFLLWTTLHLRATYIPLVVMLVLSNLPLCIWIIKGFFDDIPKEFEEAGLVDGLSDLSVFCRIAVPLSFSGIVAAGGFIFIQSWNEFTFSFLLTGDSNKTLPVQIAQFVTPTGTLWGQITSASVIATLPQFFLLLLLQKYLVRGFSLGIK